MSGAFNYGFTHRPLLQFDILEIKAPKKLHHCLNSKLKESGSLGRFIKCHVDLCNIHPSHSPLLFRCGGCPIPSLSWISVIPPLSWRCAVEQGGISRELDPIPEPSLFPVPCVWECVDTRMAVFNQSSSLLWTYLCMAMLGLLAGGCLGGSDSPRGVSLPFVFDLNAVCDPPCRHAGICIRNSTCLCSRGYEGETCQYGDVSTFYSFNKCGRLWGVCDCVYRCTLVYSFHFGYLIH